MKVGIIFTITVVLFLCYLPGSEFFIPGANEDEEVIYPGNIHEGPDGNIYIYDAKSAFIKVFSPSGKFVRKIGGIGEGPGFIKRADGVVFGFTPGNKLFFTEFFRGHNWITLMNLNGKLDKTIPINIDSYFFGVSGAQALPDDYFLVNIEFISKAHKKHTFFLQAFPSTLYLIDGKGNPCAKLKTTNYYRRISFLESGADIGIPFSPSLSWHLFKDKYVIYTESTSKDLTVTDFKGKSKDTIKTPIPGPQPVTNEDIDQWRKSIKERFYATEHGKEWYNRFGKVAELYKDSVYPLKNCIHDFCVTPGGNLLITCPSSNPKENRFWLLDPRGSKLTMVSVSAFQLKITNNFIFLLGEDDEGTTVIKCYNRKGNEKDDLLRLFVKTGKKTSSVRTND